MKTKILSVIICVFLIFSLQSETFCADKYNISKTINETCDYLISKNDSPQYGDEWTIFCLARNNVKKYKSYISRYLEAVYKHVQENNGVLSSQKYTEYARTAIALAACGKDPADFEGFDLLKPLTDYDAVVSQGINGVAWALIAMDSVNYYKYNGQDFSGVRDEYINYLLMQQLENGAWSLDGIYDYTGDISLTAMIITALSEYYDYSIDVSIAIDRAISFLSYMQGTDGSFTDSGDSSSESISQAIVALNTLRGKYDDDDFVKNDSLLDALMQYQKSGSGFKHYTLDNVNEIASQQAAYALISIKMSEAESSDKLFNLTQVEEWNDGLGSTEKALIVLATLATAVGLIWYIKSRKNTKKRRRKNK